ncbi:MAG: class III signal peptide-containing protein [Methanobacterium paludis]|nr:class III signal peptide-containing protein [Methanobacterium paludis]
MDQRAQISMEYVLFLAMVVVIVSLFGVYVSDQAELNSVSAAVKLGAENATTNLVITNSNMQPVRVTNISMSSGYNVTVQIHFSNSVSNIQNQILSSINKSLTSQGYSTWYNGSSQTSIPLKTNKHFYNITLN